MLKLIAILTLAVPAGAQITANDSSSGSSGISAVTFATATINNALASGTPKTVGSRATLIGDTSSHLYIDDGTAAGVIDISWQSTNTAITPALNTTNQFATGVSSTFTFTCHVGLCYRYYYNGTATNDSVNAGFATVPLECNGCASGMTIPQGYSATLGMSSNMARNAGDSYTISPRSKTFRCTANRNVTSVLAILSVGAGTARLCNATNANNVSSCEYGVEVFPCPQ